MQNSYLVSGMLAFVYTVVFVAALSVPLLYVHQKVYGDDMSSRAVAMHGAVVVFNAVNVMICLWENALFLHQKSIKEDFLALKKKHGKSLPPDAALFRDISFAQACSLKFWGVIWSTYSLLDPSYSDTTTFGFWIDTGNGFSMPIPTLLLSLGMTWDVVPPRALGAIALAANWQMMYGTFLYFSSYAYNARYRGCSATAVAIVIVANAIWIVFPAVAMCVGWAMIQTGSFDIVRR